MHTPIQKIALTATFTAEPVEESLAFWIQELKLPYQIEFALYNQVFQQLLDPSSLFSQNAKGINVVLVRFEDWQRFENYELSGEVEVKLPETESENISRNVQELVMGLKSAASRSSTPHIVCLCPASSTAGANRMEFFQEMEALIVSELSGIGGVYLIRGTDLAAYPVENYYDPQSDKLGHIPFTPVFFTVLGTAIARKIYAIKSAPHKVIVLDCDNSLWKGVVGEDGVTGIEVPAPWKALQEFMVAQQNAGMLICLCSKNNEADVVEVFEQRQEMPLKREQIVSWRINWLPKSENIKSLAAKLSLGLDSFIFIDDNPVECAEVQVNCPEVLTLQLPSPSAIARFLNHVWAFDRVKVTEEDRQRTALYKQNLERDHFRDQSLTIGDFLAGLDLKVETSELGPHLARVSQLTQRTNQFNFTTIRRSEAEIQQLCQSGKFECRVVEVSDRFGDYGLVGVIIFEHTAEAIKVDTFLLSCCVLGRGVEHRMFTHLAEIAKERGLIWVDISLIPTQKNQPALNFLDSVGADFKQPLDQEYRFCFPVEFAAAVSYKLQVTEPKPQSDIAVKTDAVTGATPPSEKSAQLNWIATKLYEPEQILQFIESQQRQSKALETRFTQQTFVAPRTETEKVLADIWAKLLHFEQVGIHDNFFELGGTSVLAVRLLTQVQGVFAKELPLPILLTAPTIEQLVNIICAQGLPDPVEALVPLQPKGDKPPLFCIYGIFLYQDLAYNFGSKQPVYGVYIHDEVELLKAGGLQKQQTALTSVAEQATLYLKEIRTLQPVGPYFLAGESFGGLVAFEMAQQLQRQGEKVALVVLFDTDAPGGMKKLPRSKRVLLHLAKLLQAGPTYALEKVGRKLDSSKDRLVRSISRIYGKFAHSSEHLLPSDLEKVAT